MTEIMWLTDRCPEADMPKVAEEIGRLIEGGLSNCRDLIFHDIWLDDDPTGRCVYLTGVKAPAGWLAASYSETAIPERNLRDVWRHKKTDGLYEIVTYDAKIEANLERAVVYVSLAHNTIWVRPYAEFMDGRFERMSAPFVRRAAGETGGGAAP